MSTTPRSATSDAVPVSTVARPGTKKVADHIVVYDHSNLAYRWPVWLVCFILAEVTYADGDRSGGVTVSIILPDGWRADVKIGRLRVERGNR